MKQLLDKIRQQRMSKEFSQEYMALKLGYSSPKGYSNIETGKSELTVNKLVKIAEILEVPLGFLLENEGKVFQMNNTFQDTSVGINNVHTDRDYINHLKSEINWLRKHLEEMVSLMDSEKRLK